MHLMLHHLLLLLELELLHLLLLSSDCNWLPGSCRCCPLHTSSLKCRVAPHLYRPALLHLLLLGAILWRTGPEGHNSSLRL